MDTTSINQLRVLKQSLEDTIRISVEALTLVNASIDHASELGNFLCDDISFDYKDYSTNVIPFRNNGVQAQLTDVTNLIDGDRK